MLLFGSPQIKINGFYRLRENCKIISIRNPQNLTSLCFLSSKGMQLHQPTEIHYIIRRALLYRSYSDGYFMQKMCTQILQINCELVQPFFSYPVCSKEIVCYHKCLAIFPKELLQFFHQHFILKHEHKDLLWDDIFVLVFVFLVYDDNSCHIQYLLLTLKKITCELQCLVIFNSSQKQICIKFC